AMKKLEVIKVLLQHKAKPALADKSGQTPMHLAVTRGDLDVVKTLLDNGGKLKDEQGLFSHALSLGWVDLGRYLLEKGADINEPGFAGMTGLLWAISRGDAKSVAWLLDKGADINLAAKTNNKPGAWTPLTLAVHNERLEVVELLLKHGAD